MYTVYTHIATSTDFGIVWNIFNEQKKKQTLLRVTKSLTGKTISGFSPLFPKNLTLDIIEYFSLD